MKLRLIRYNLLRGGDENEEKILLSIRIYINGVPHVCRL